MQHNIGELRRLIYTVDPILRLDESKNLLVFTNPEDGIEQIFRGVGLLHFWKTSSAFFFSGND
jgi:hypothetical protein